MGQRKSGHVTLLDIARASGFSVSTVSIVLSEAPLSQNVAATTRTHIRTIAQQLGYHPDAYARSLRRRSTQTIGIVAFDLSDPFCIPIVRGIQAKLQPSAYFPLLMDVQTQRALFDDYLHMLLERRADAVIVIASWVFEEMNLLGDVRKNNVPILIIGRDLSARGTSSILVDNEEGGALAMRHLYELGHRRIAVIRGPQELCDSEPRWKGVRDVAAQCGMKLDERLVFQLPGVAGPASGFAGGLQFTRAMLTAGQPFSAVLAFDDLTALGVVRGLREAGLRVPEDCSVMGFDDILPAEVATPAMTTIRQPLREMGMEAAERVLQAIRGKEKKVRLHRTRPELVVRMSTASPPTTFMNSRNGNRRS
ncbi:MAG TPA: LacI family DNA-binding transcriptional regulator [Acidobacteriaceae bacterium]|nr:LacI family DNA-binding transcriptional regulator [Acidobacteriaceae bacterium]